MGCVDTDHGRYGHNDVKGSGRRQAFVGKLKQGVDECRARLGEGQASGRRQEPGLSVSKVV